MKFLVDAQLPRALATCLHAAEHDAIHTLDLPGGNRTPDAEIARIANETSRVVITKDADFVISHLFKEQPQKLLLISTGISVILNYRQYSGCGCHLSPVRSHAVLSWS